jgi:hypothetical protein
MRERIILNHLINTVYPTGELTMIQDAAVVLHNGNRWKVINRDPSGPQTNICWKRPGFANHWLARVDNEGSMLELYRRMDRPLHEPRWNFHCKHDGEVSFIVSSAVVKGVRQGVQVESIVRYFAAIMDYRVIERVF